MSESKAVPKKKSETQKERRRKAYLKRKGKLFSYLVKHFVFVGCPTEKTILVRVQDEFSGASGLREELAGAHRVIDRIRRDLDVMARNRDEAVQNLQRYQAADKERRTLEAEETRRQIESIRATKNAADSEMSKLRSRVCELARLLAGVLAGEDLKLKSDY